MALKIDLHLHTTESDGMLDPAALLRSVASAGLDYFAITDHDTMAAYLRVPAFYSAHPNRLISGIELSTAQGGKEVHILGYDISPGCEALKSLLGNRTELRVRRAEEIIAKLNEAGIVITMDDVRRQTSGEIIGRAHIARALVERRLARDNDDAFARYIGSSGLAYTPLSNVLPADAIQAIRNCGGIAVVAHPARNGVGVLIEELREAGLQGLEAFSPSHSMHEIEHFRWLAKNLGLVVSAGTDFHQPTALHPLPGVEIDEEDLAPFLSLLHARA